MDQVVPPGHRLFAHVGQAVHLVQQHVQEDQEVPQVQVLLRDRAEAARVVAAVQLPVVVGLQVLVRVLHLPDQEIVMIVHLLLVKLIQARVHLMWFAQEHPIGLLPEEL